MRNRRRGAFTLIELLVSVAIIALLIALLIPQLAKAKELARRASCAADFRSLGIGYRAYATEFQDFLPIGVNGNGSVSDGTGNSDVRDCSWVIYSQKPSGFTVCGYKGLGMPAAIGAFTGNGPYFCPSALLNIPQRIPGNAKNPIWPPVLAPRPWDGGGDCFDITSGNPLRNTQAIATYSVRPTIPDGEYMVPGGMVCYHLVPQKTSPYLPGDPRYYNSAPTFPPGFAYDGRYSGVNGQGVAMPKATAFRSSLVIASDFVCGKAYIDLVHKDGVNVLRLDGSAAYMSRGVFDLYLSEKAPPWLVSPAPPWSQTDYTGPGAGETNIFANYKKIWDLMDLN